MEIWAAVSDVLETWLNHKESVWHASRASCTVAVYVWLLTASEANISTTTKLPLPWHWPHSTSTVHRLSLRILHNTGYALITQITLWETELVAFWARSSVITCQQPPVVALTQAWGLRLIQCHTVDRQLAWWVTHWQTHCLRPLHHLIYNVSKYLLYLKG